MDPSCLQSPGVPAGPSDSVFSLLAGLLFLVFAAAAVASPLVRSRYRRWVTRLMALDQVSARPDGWWTGPGLASAGAAASAAPATQATAALRARAAQVETRITRATLIAWGVFALFGAAAGGVLGTAHTLGTRLLFGVGIALLAIGPALTNMPERWSRRALAIGVLAAAVGGTLLQYLDPEADSIGDVLLGGLVLGVAYLVMFHRSLSGQVVPLFVAFGVCALVFFVPMLLLDAHAGSCYDRQIDAAAAAFRSQLGEAALPTKPHLATPLLLLAGTLFGTLAVWLGFRALAGLIWLGDHGWFSELSLASFLTLGLVTLALTLGATAADVHGTPPIVAALPLAWLAVTAGAYAWALGSTPATVAAPQLLILRVFAQKSRQHTLLDRLQQRWRYLGPVHQIGGPDLVALNVDLHECAMFLAGRLHELFLPEAASLAQLQSRLRTGADREGRFRINEVFCFNTAWRPTVEQLMQLSQVIVLDLRGFTRRREGTGYEISLLGRHRLLGRVVAVGDAATRWPDVEALLREADADPAQLARLNDDVELDALFERLLAVAVAEGAERNAAARLQ
jgi:hypothetical protein